MTFIGCTPLLQSMSLNASRPLSSRNPLFDLAYSMTGMQERVAGIPVYTVANKSNELVLVAGEVMPEVACKMTANMTQ